MIARLAMLVVVSLTASACGVSGLGFMNDHRIDIVEPRDRESVTLPVRIDWEVDGFAGRFGVLVDRAPPRPGRTLESLLQNDTDCRAAEGCPDVDRLASSYIFTTSDTELLLEQVPKHRGKGRELHDAVIVLLDDQGRRDGEAAFRVQFEVERDE